MSNLSNNNQIYSLNAFLKSSEILDAFPKLNNDKNNLSKLDLALNLIKMNSSKDLKEILQALNLLKFLIENMDSEEFSNNANKILRDLNEIYKYYMNYLKSNLNSGSLYHQDNKQRQIIDIVTLINSTFTLYYSKFNEFYQNYNDSMKNIIKNLPNSLKVFIKLIEDLYDEDNTLFIFAQNLTKSFLISIIALINYFPTILRSFYSKLDNFIKNLFSLCLNSEYSSETFTSEVEENESESTITPSTENLLDVLVLAYCSLLKLATDFPKKFFDFQEKILNNVLYFLNLSVPKTIKTKKSFDDEIFKIFNYNNSNNNNNNKQEKEEGKIIFKDFNLSKEDNKTSKKRLSNLIDAVKIIKILIKILKTSYLIIPQNLIIEVNLYKVLFIFFENFEKFENKSFIINNNLIKPNDYLIDGLTSIFDFSIFTKFYFKETLNLFSFFIKHYSLDLTQELDFVIKLAKKIILNLENFIPVFEINISILKFFNLIVKKLDLKVINSLIQEIIFKFTFQNFILYFLKFIELKDKTVIKIDENYFKISTIKNKKNDKKRSLIQMHNSEVNDNLGIERLSSRKIEEIVLNYLKSNFHFNSLLL